MPQKVKKVFSFETIPALFETIPALKVILAKKHSPNINNKTILQFRSLKYW